MSITNPASGNRVYMARITFVEIVSAITRRERGGHLSATDANVARIAFEQDYLNEFRKVEISEALISEAAILARKHGLRGCGSTRRRFGNRIGTPCAGLIALDFAFRRQRFKYGGNG